MLLRAYSTIEVKAVDEERRIIEGIASTPSPDRMEDVVEPLGAEFKLPIPFLWQHDSRSPIGHVTKAKPTKDGIPVTIQLAKTDEPGPVKDRLDGAWQDIKLGLVRGLSIGFQSKESTDLEGTRWGRRFVKWEWLELSAVTIPANADASITAIKSIDAQLRAASGREQPGDQQDPARRLGPVKLTHTNRGATVKTIADRIAAFEATRAAKAARMHEIQDAATEAGQTKDAAQREEFNTLRDEIKSIDEELVDLREMEKLSVARAQPVAGTSAQTAAQSRGGEAAAVIVKHEPKVEPGIQFARYAMATFAAQGNPDAALRLLQRHYPRHPGIPLLQRSAHHGITIEKALFQQKAAVAAGTTLDSDWAAPLVDYNTFTGDFVEYLRPRTIIGQFGMNGVPDLNRIPFNVSIKGQTVGGTGYWVGEGKPKPVTAFGFNSVDHRWFKVAAISVLTEELMRFSDPSAERLVRNALAKVLIERIDTDFVDPDFAGSANVSPASITNGVVAIGSSGDDADAVRADIQALWAAAVAADMDLTDAVYITTPAIALALSLMMNPIGSSREFPEISIRGGSLLGVPVIVSNYVEGGDFILAFASEIYLSDDGEATVDFSREASLQMLDNPTNDSNTPTPTTLVSMYQTDSVALRAHRFVNWSKRRSTAVAMLEGVTWGGSAY